MTSSKQGFLDITEQSQMWTHCGCDSIHKTTISSRYRQSQAIVIWIFLGEIERARKGGNGKRGKDRGEREEEERELSSMMEHWV